MRTILFVLLIAVVASACRKPDVTAPVIESVTVNGHTDNVVVAAGGNLHLEARFSDDRELREYKIDIHNAFDGHGHGKRMSTIPFSHQQVVPMSGTTFTDHRDIAIPANASSGPYHMVIRAIDAAGNESEILEINITITNPSQPVINVAYPFPNTTWHFHLGESIIIDGNVTDDVDLEEIHIILVRDSGNGHAHTPLYNEEFELPGSSDTFWDFSEMQAAGKTIQIPANAAVGHYEVIIKAKDSDGNYTIRTFEVDID